MEEQLRNLEKEAKEQIQAASDLKELENIRVSYLGKKGPITEILRGMSKLSKEERPKIGQLANEVQEAITEQLEGKKKRLEEEQLEKQLAEETIDVTLPSRPVKQGGHHPLTAVIEEVEDLFLGMGFSIAEGPQVETDYYNFEAMNIPKNHPARDMQDTFFLTDNILLRTHTSPVQARTMEAYHGKGPVKVICPGVTYRRDADDATHSHQFMQIEGLVVGEGIRLSDLKGVLTLFAQKIFGEDRETRFRCNYFPFTEPSAEMDISCSSCNGKGCSVCKGTGWVEILGSGMVHPNVLRMSGFDPEVYTGFAFGMGPERIAMLKYGIEDIRHFYNNDKRFLRQFARV